MVADYEERRERRRERLEAKADQLARGNLTRR